MTTVAAPAAEPATEPSVSNGRLAFVVIAPTAAWALHELVCSVASVVVCAAGYVTAARMTVWVASVVALGFAIAGGVCGYTSWRRFAGDERVVDAEARGGREMLAFAGFLLGIVFTLALLWGALSSILVGDICGASI